MSNKKPDISIFGSAHRPQNWIDLYKSIGDNTVDFELVFVGPNPPDFKLPKNFRFIKSLVKPTQCLEIAFRNTSADLVMNMADDCKFQAPRSLDSLYQAYQSYSNDKIILSCRYMLDGQEHPACNSHFFGGDISSPVVPLSGLISKKLWISIGGIDRNFIAIMWDLDMAMRVHALGGDVILSDVFLNEKSSAGSILCKEFWKHDREVLDELWTINGKVHLNRKRPVEPFLDKDILTASQGPRGRWRGRGSIFFERIEDKYRATFGYRSIFRRISRGIRKPSMYFNYAKRIASHINKTVTEFND